MGLYNVRSFESGIGTAVKRTNIGFIWRVFEAMGKKELNGIVLLTKVKQKDLKCKPYHDQALFEIILN